MNNKNHRPTHEEYIGMLETSNWDLVTGNEAFPVKDRTLKQLLHTTHERNKKGEAPGIIANMETKLELAFVDMEKLWEYLGLPK